VERLSEHPLARAIVAEAERRGIQVPSPTEFKAVPGFGAMAMVPSLGQVMVGRRRFLAESGVLLPPQPNSETDTSVHVAVRGQWAGYIEISDTIRANAVAALNVIRRAGISVVMLTGDNAASAAAVAKSLGITDFEAEVLPAQKVEAIRKLRAAGHRVAFAGDGINDAPALAAADVGIAMGTGTDVAIESGGITLLSGDLIGIVRAWRLSRATLRNIRQNLFWAFFYNVVGVPLAAGVLYPVFGRAALLSPIVAAAAMSFSSVTVIGNSLRLRKVQLAA
jgi:Cu+-exporting ATPase